MLGYLAANGGEAPSKDIFKAARGENIAERTLKRARTRTRTRARTGVDYERTGFPSATYWRISQSGDAVGGRALVGGGPVLCVAGRPPHVVGGSR